VVTIKFHGVGENSTYKSPAKTTCWRPLIRSAVEAGISERRFQRRTTDGLEFDLNQPAASVEQFAGIFAPALGRTTSGLRDTLSNASIKGSRTTGVTSARGKKQASRHRRIILAAAPSTRRNCDSVRYRARDMRAATALRSCKISPASALICKTPDGLVAMSNPGAEYALSWRTARVPPCSLHYLLGRSGMLASNAAEAGGFLHSRAGLARPICNDVHGWIEGQPAHLRAGTVLCCTSRYSGGDARPARAFIHDRRPAGDVSALPWGSADVEAMIAGLKQARHIISNPHCARYSGAELNPVGGEERCRTGSIHSRQRRDDYHPVGTCKMGPAT